MVLTCLLEACNLFLYHSSQVEFEPKQLGMAYPTPVVIYPLIVIVALT